MQRIADISNWILNPASGFVLSGDIGLGAIQSGCISSGQVGWSHLARGSVPAVLSQGGSAIALRSLTDQTASNSGLVVTISGTGIYRVNTYAEIAQGGLLNAGNLALRLDWTSDSQAQNFSPITGLALLTSGAFSQGVTAIRALSGTQIISTVTLSSLTGAPHYNAWTAVERVV